MQQQAVSCRCDGGVLDGMGCCMERTRLSRPAHPLKAAASGVCTAHPPAPWCGNEHPPAMHPLQIPQRFLMGPGPANADPRILAAQSLPLLGHM